MTNRYELAVDGYVQLAGYLFEEWGKRLTDLAGHIDKGTLNPETLLSTASECAAFAMQSVALVVNETFDAAAMMTGTQDEPHVVVSAQFHTSSAGDAASGPRTLRLTGPMIADLGHDALPVSAITLRPDSLAADETEFELAVDATGHPAIGYSGTVNVFDAPGGCIESIDVWVTT